MSNAVTRSSCAGDASSVVRRGAVRIRIPDIRAAFAFLDRQEGLELHRPDFEADKSQNAEERGQFDRFNGEIVPSSLGARVGRGLAYGT